MREQDFNDRRVPWTQDWKRYLTKNDFPPIGNAFVSCANPKARVETWTVSDDGTSVTFLLSNNGITKSTTVAVTVHIVLTSGSELEEDMHILFTNI